MDYKLLNEDAASDLNDNVEHELPISESNYQATSVRVLLVRHRWHFIHWTLFLLQLALLGFWLASSWPPKQALIEMQYGRDFNYMSLDHKFDNLWSGEEIEEAGVIQLKDHGGRYNEVENGAISMFHQLHCLRAIRKALQDGHEGRLVAMDYRQAPHWPHCLWYLRQAIICRADAFVEHEESWNGIEGFVDGASDVRQCRDTAPLYELYSEKNRKQYLVDD